MRIFSNVCTNKYFNCAPTYAVNMELGAHGFTETMGHSLLFGVQHSCFGLVDLFLLAGFPAERMVAPLENRGVGFGTLFQGLD